MSGRFSRMSKSQKAIASYISDHYDEAVFMTAAKLGEALHISESTVVRFALMLGYEGYPEFQKALEGWVKDQLTSVQRMGVKYAGSTQSEVLFYKSNKIIFNAIHLLGGQIKSDRNVIYFNNSHIRYPSKF